MSTFLLHEKSYESHSVLNAEIAVLVRRFARLELSQMRGDLPDPAHPTRPLLTASLLRLLRRANLAALLHAEASLQLTRYRQNSHGMWIFSPRVWRTRHVRMKNRVLEDRCKMELKQFLRSVPG
ncbi:MAG: hypothetical protein QM790_00560 [Nibricoccus sp.]